MQHVASAEEMFDLGKQIGAQCKPGDHILLTGPLGAGKTLLAQGIGAALGVEEITSPTFVIARKHSGQIPIVHVDLYRLLDSANLAAAIEDLDLETDADKSVTIIEWASPEYSALQADRLEITIDRTTEVRQVSIKPIGPRWKNFTL
uniref:tRNA (adenosine(37)-N6)-threonylcarbamoyltransferase complex ATPase subunit type 1 TsaE n=1 Tax=Candidatus Planktophila sp. TaxID=2175601 RepID=UPI004049DA1A